MASLMGIMSEAPPPAPAGIAEPEAEDALATLSTAHELDNPVVVICGATDYSAVGDAKKAKETKATSLLGLHRLTGTRLDGRKVTNLISGPSSNHIIALTNSGVFAWGSECPRPGRHTKTRITFVLNGHHPARAALFTAPTCHTSRLGFCVCASASGRACLLLTCLPAALPT